MLRAIGSPISKLILSLCFIVALATANAQPPTTNPPGGVDPTKIDPKTLTPTQLKSLLEDGNKDNGKDRNEALKNKKVEKDSLLVNGTNRTERGIRTFGQEAFASAANSDLATLSTPPLDYPIGVGDIIVVALWGGADYQEEYFVGRDGAIFPKGLGKIYVAGFTFENVQRIVSARFQSVTPAGTNVQVTLGQPRTINVNVVGEVEKPGPITVSAFSNAFNVIALAGGGNEYADLRKIVVKRQGVVIDELDVYKYLTTGEFGRKQYLQNGDFVIVGVVKKKVLASGEFKRPMYYQLKEDEGVKALLFFTGGLTPEALASNMKVLRSEDEQQKVKDVNANAIISIKGEDFALKDGDIVTVGLIKPGIRNKVELTGEVTYPNFYELRPGDRLFDIINRAGGVTKNTYLKKAFIFKGAGDSTKINSDRLEVDLTALNDGNFASLNNVKLDANDRILLFSNSNFVDGNYVEVFGEVRKEGKLPKYGGMTLQDLIFLSGGLKPTAEFGRLEIASVVDIDSARAGLRPTATKVQSYFIDSDLNIDSAAAKVILKPFDQVFVRKNPTFNLQQNVTLKGLLKYPGKYPKLKRNERISSYIDRAGGFKDNANLSGAVLYRNKNQLLRENLVTSTRVDSLGRPIIDEADILQKKALNDVVSIDLAKALRYKNSKHDLILQEDDILIVPEINPFVSVEGKVQSPLKINFDKEHTNLLYYIDKAGGFGVKPWRNRVYVKYANGTSRRTKNFGFFHFYPRVREGSLVVVPEKPQGQEIGDIIKSVFITAVPIVVSAIIVKAIR